LDDVREIENCTGLMMKKDFLPMVLVDVERIWVDESLLKDNFGYNRNTAVTAGEKKLPICIIIYCIDYCFTKL